MARTYKQGLFKPKNPHKYKGNVNNIVYRSGWELSLMEFLDEHPEVVEWSSEEIIIPYRCPIRRDIHRYFPDFWAKFVDGRQVLIEVKPKAQTKPPKKPEQKISRRYKQEAVTYVINEAKWQAARQYCDHKGWQFIIITEDQIFRRQFV